MNNKLNTEKTIILFTSNYEGGIFQFTMKVAEVLSKDNYKVIVFIPKETKKTINDNDIDYIMYEKKKTILNANKANNYLVSKIFRIKPNLVLFCDDSIVSLQNLLLLNRFDYPTSIFIHDVLPHLEKFNLYNKIKQRIKNRLLKKTLSIVDQVILLSRNSYNLFEKKHSNYIQKATWMPIGAHIPSVNPIAPIELEEIKSKKYFLFFGRISKYKGIENLINAFNMINSENKRFLVIAGSGKFTETEEKLLGGANKIITINRYIDDGEMIYLIKNSISVVLPYIEASQSGVIPIAYHFGIPVITSNVPGLSEYVVDCESGLICSNNFEIKEAMLSLENKDFYNNLKNGAKKYYMDNLNWATNLNRCLKFLLEGGGTK